MSHERLVNGDGVGAVCVGAGGDWVCWGDGSDGSVGDVVTKAEKEHQAKVASFGCIACWLDGKLNLHVSIHHVNGRTKPGAHMQVLPLCAGHHQDGAGQDKTLIAVHPYKARFERAYGSQKELLERLSGWINNGRWE